MTCPRFNAYFVLALCLVAAQPRAIAQETREEQLAAARAEKSRHLHPYVPTAGERRIEMIEKALVSPSTVYPFIGSIFPGGWLAVGPGYRTRFAESGTFDVHGAWSVRNYKTGDATLNLPAFGEGRVGIDVRGNWIEAPKVAFNGVGNESRPEDKTSFLYRATTVGFGAKIRAAPLLAVGGGLDALDIESGAGTSGTSIERVFTAANAPGLGASPTYTRSRLFAEVDWRESAGYTRRGGLYRVDWSDYRQTSGGPYSFRRLDAEVAQFVPILRANWVIALRALASTTDTDQGDSVPYFLMPDLGGSRTLRGYPSWRFRDRNRMLLTGEYRWTAGQFIDMALFLDAGKVASRRSDLDFSGLRRSYGLGIRFHVPDATILRIEAAHTSEGVSLVWAFGPVF